MLIKKIILVIYTFVLSSHLYAQQSDYERVFNGFWNSANTQEAQSSIADIIQSGISFDEAYQALQTGKVYQQAETGVVLRSYEADDGIEYFYHLNVPDNYVPTIAITSLINCIRRFASNSSTASNLSENAVTRGFCDGSGLIKMFIELIVASRIKRGRITPLATCSSLFMMADSKPSLT